jgi:DNA-binding NarL/FixJ family response regulator
MSEIITKIMLVDDHPLVRDGLRARLEAVPAFAIVAEAGSAEEALQRAQQQPIDLILMDINLRGSINGIDLTARFHVSFPEIAVLILSMHDKTEYLMQSVQAGARGYVLKDAPGKDIVHAIETVISGGMYYSAALAQKLADRARTPGIAAHRRWRIEQADRARAGFKRAHRRNPQAEYQAQAGDRGSGRIDQVCGGK